MRFQVIKLFAIIISANIARSAVFADVAIPAFLAPPSINYVSQLLDVKDTNPGSERVEKNREKATYKQRVADFLKRNSQRMAEVYGQEFADPSMWGSDVAARVLVAYCDRNKEDQYWYKQLSRIQPIKDNSEQKLFVFASHTGMLAHITRTMLVAIKLRELGHEVIFAIDEDTKPDKMGNPTQRKYVSFIQNAGFEIYHLPETISAKTIMWYTQEKMSMGFHNRRTIEEQSRKQIDVLRKITKNKRKPDLIVIDFAHTMRIAADVCDIPVAATWNFADIKACPVKFHMLDVEMQGSPPEWFKRILKKLADANLIHTILKTYSFFYGLPYNWVRIKTMLRERKFIPLVWGMYEQTGGDLLLLPDYPAFKDMLVTPNILPVGPIVWEPSEDDAIGFVGDEKQVRRFEAFLDSEDDKPLIYVTMGSTGKLKLFKMIIEALKAKPCKVAITTGNQFDPSELGELSEKFFVIPMYPGGKICKKASLVINHGGAGSAAQAIKYGIPQISIPTHANQQWGSELLVREGIGKQILFSNLSVETISAYVDEMLNFLPRAEDQPDKLLVKKGPDILRSDSSKASSFVTRSY